VRIRAAQCEGKIHKIPDPSAAAGLPLAPPVKIQTDSSLKYSPYYDWKNVVAAREAQYFPDLCYRNAAWPHFTQIVGSHFSDEADALTDIICSYADVFTMLAQQHDLHQDEKTSDWVLIRGYVDWLNGKNPTKPYEGTPFISFKEPGRAYTGTVSGNDRQVAHMRDYVDSKFGIERRYINSGILNKAFYLVATKRTTKLAAEIWIATLRQIKKAGQIDFPKFAQILYPARPAIRRMQFAKRSRR
jgi:Thermolysin metallopeptidase, alpha-helical domain